MSMVESAYNGVSAVHNSYSVDYVPWRRDSQNNLIIQQEEHLSHTMDARQQTETTCVCAMYLGVISAGLLSKG